MPNAMRDRLIEIVKNSLMKHISKSCCLANNIVDDLLTEGVTTLPVAFSDNRRERMIELPDGYYEETAIGCVFYFTEKESEMLADYILADGWIRPPCKVGDKVYLPCVNDWGDIENYTITEFVLDNNGLCFVVDDEDRECHSVDNIGKTVFLNIEEAEQALKEGADNAE